MAVVADPPDGSRVAFGRGHDGLPCAPRLVWPTTFLQRPYTFTRIIAQRARYACLNHEFCKNGAAELVSGMIGGGISAEPSLDDADSRATLVKAFRQWGLGADAEGRTNWNGLQSLIASEIVISGEALIHTLPGDNGLKLRVIPADRLDYADFRQLDGGGAVIAGVEIAPDGRRAAYCLERTISASRLSESRQPTFCMSSNRNSRARSEELVGLRSFCSFRTS